MKDKNKIQLPNYDLREIQHLIYSKNIKPLNKALTETLKKLGLYDNIIKIKIKKIWHYIVGPQIAQYTVDIFITNNVLYIKILSPALKQNLILQRRQILQKINTILNINLKNIVIY